MHVGESSGIVHRQWWAIIAAFSLIACAGCESVVGLSAKHQAPIAHHGGITPAKFNPGAPGPGWVPILQDRFTGRAGSPVNPAIWRYDIGHGIFGTGEIETMTNSSQNVFQNGHHTLIIQAIKSSNGQWTSGRIQTRRDYGAPPGGAMLVTALIQQPNPLHGLGYWPAFWLLGPGQWPEHGEIDIFEDVNAKSAASHHLHCGVDPGGPCHEPNGLGTALLPVPGAQTHFVRYSVLINRMIPGHQTIQWFVGQRPVFAISEHQLPLSVWRDAVDHGFAIILDLAIGGAYPDGVAHLRTPTAATTSGGRLAIRNLTVFIRHGR
jgi:hypothetical protein